MAVDSYLKDDPGSYYALLTTCHTCMPNKANSCPDCSVSTTKTITGEDPDTGSSITWASEDISQAASRSSLTDRWPYQIITQSQSLGCSSNCVYLIRIQYKLQTSSTRRSFLQSGFSDIWLVERWNSSGQIQEMHNVANSVPFDHDNSEIMGAYTAGAISAKKKTGTVATERTHFNPYGLRETYDPNVNVYETHCGTLLFFARGDDTIKFRLAQHTRINSSIDINPDSFTIRSNASVQSPHEDYSGGNYGAQGEFNIKAYTRPIPGHLKLSDKGASSIETRTKYHPYLFA